MSTVVNALRAGFYMDSVALMRLSRQIASLDGVEEAGLMMATPANLAIMADAGVLAKDGVAAKAAPGDLVLAIRAKTKAAADAALAAAQAILSAPRAASRGATYRPRTLAGAVAANPAANLALISVPGDFAAAEAFKALRRGLHVMMFSDNVSIADELALKHEALRRGLLMMGPDCGTAILGGVPLAFANVVPRGDIGIVGASGTGIQEVTCLIANNGGGISHAIGTGGRDLKHEIGGITTLMAIDLLDADPATRHIVVISKPPATSVAETVLARVALSPKTFTICFIGGTPAKAPANAAIVCGLKAAVEHALGRVLPAVTLARPGKARGKKIRGLFSGGTLCAEAQVLVRDAGLGFFSNVPLHGALTLADKADAILIDLGDDDFTRGRPHPMIEPAVRDQPFAEALADASVGVILTDIVLGFGGHRDPAGHLAALVARAPKKRPSIVASVTGTAGDPQGRAGQIALLEAAGIVVAPSNADATALALSLIGA